MSNAVFPTFVGLRWGRLRTPVWKTLLQEAMSGREARAALWSAPRWKYALSYEVLRSSASLHELQDLVGFFQARQGSFDTWLFLDWEDYTVTGQAIGTGNGSATQFQLVRTFGGHTETCRDIVASPAPQIYLAGVLQESGYSIGSTGIVTFAVAPGNGVAVTATFQYYWRCRFLEDEVEFSSFAYQLWEAQKVEFITVKP